MSIVSSVVFTTAIALSAQVEVPAPPATSVSQPFAWSCNLSFHEGRMQTFAGDFQENVRMGTFLNSYRHAAARLTLNPNSRFPSDGHVYRQFSITPTAGNYRMDLTVQGVSSSQWSFTFGGIGSRGAVVVREGLPARMYEAPVIAVGFCDQTEIASGSE